MKLIHWLFVLALFTSSFDIILIANIGGSVRFCQLLLAVVDVAALGMMLQRRSILWPKAGSALLIWYLLQTLLVPFNLAGQIGYLYHLLIGFTLFSVYAVVQLYGRSSFVPALMKAYLYSFVFVGFFGLFQFVTPPLHLGEWLVAQWISHGKIARINGFSYEPSYFVTYMVMGCIMLIDLRISGAAITAGRRWKWFTVALALVFFLSTSKTAWVFIILEILARLAPNAWRGLRKQVRRIFAGSLIVPLPRFRILLAMAAVAGVGVIGMIALSQVIDLNIFIAGTGINNTAAHSVNDRTGRFFETMQVFRERPFIGWSLPGVAGRLAQEHGAAILNVGDFRLWWGNPVIADVLAGSGIFGIIPFLWFFLSNTLGEYPLIRAHWPEERAKWMRALVRALIFECLILIADQNLVRTYVWFHVTMVAVVGFNLRFVANPVRQQEAEPERELAVA